MKLSNIVLAGIIAACLAAPALRSSADDTYHSGTYSSTDTGDDSWWHPGPYLTLDGGVNFIQDGIVASRAGGPGFKGDFETGWRAGLTFGLNLNRFVAIEAESGFMHNEVRGGNDLWYGVVPILGNLVFRYDNCTGFTPYIGGGAGGAWTMFEGDNVDQKDFVFAYQAKAGVTFKVAPGMFVDVGYKFFNTYQQGYDSFTLTHPYAHYGGASFTWRF